MSARGVVVTHLVGCGWTCSHQSSSRRITLKCGECCEGLVVGVQVRVKTKSQQEPCAYRRTHRQTHSRTGHAEACPTRLSMCCC